jgi:hypothetical protein
MDSVHFDTDLIGPTLANHFHSKERIASRLSPFRLAAFRLSQKTLFLAKKEIQVDGDL